MERETGQLRYLTRADVAAAASSIDSVQVIEQALQLHALGSTTLPEEAYLPWNTPDGHSARSLVLPGALWGEEPVLGIKLINSSLGNVAAGRPRADGLTVLFDPETSYPVAVLDAAMLSALRTSAYTASSVLRLGPPSVTQVALIGCGVLGSAHVRMLAPLLPGAQFALCDSSPERRDVLVRELSTRGVASRIGAESIERAVRGAQVVITTTTTTTGYIPFAWLGPGTFVAHVSLDDVLPDVVLQADLVIVDDWPLIRSDSRRLLGRMYRTGELRGPAGMDDEPASPAGVPGVRRVDSSLADVIAGRHPGRTTADQIILSNPFGMGILDVALAGSVLSVAEREGLGTLLPR